MMRKLWQRELGLIGSPSAEVYFRRRAAESLRVDGLWELGDAPQALLQCFSPCGQHLVGVAMDAQELLCWRVHGNTYALRPEDPAPGDAGPAAAELLFHTSASASPPTAPPLHRPLTESPRPSKRPRTLLPPPPSLQHLEPSASSAPVAFSRFFPPLWALRLPHPAESYLPDLCHFTPDGRFLLVASAPAPGPPPYPLSAPPPTPTTLHVMRMRDGARTHHLEVLDVAHPLSGRGVQVFGDLVAVLTESPHDATAHVYRLSACGMLDELYRVGRECRTDDEAQLQGLAEDEAAVQQRMHDYIVGRGGGGGGGGGGSTTGGDQGGVSNNAGGEAVTSVGVANSGSGAGGGAGVALGAGADSAIARAASERAQGQAMGQGGAGMGATGRASVGDRPHVTGRPSVGDRSTAADSHTTPLRGSASALPGPHPLLPGQSALMGPHGMGPSMISEPIGSNSLIPGVEGVEARAALPGEPSFRQEVVRNGVVRGAEGNLAGLAQKLLTWLVQWHAGQDCLRWVFRCFPALSRPRIRAGHFLSRTHLLLLIAFPDLPPAPSLPRLAPAASESCQCAVSVYALPDARVEMASFLPTKELMAKLLEFPEVWGSSPSVASIWEAAAQSGPALPLSTPPCARTHRLSTPPHPRTTPSPNNNNATPPATPGPFCDACAAVAAGAEPGRGGCCSAGLAGGVCPDSGGGAYPHPSQRDETEREARGCQVPVTAKDLAPASWRRSASFSGNLQALGAFEPAPRASEADEGFSSTPPGLEASQCQCHKHMVSELQELLRRAFSNRAAHPSPLLDPSLFSYESRKLSLLRPTPPPADPTPVAFVRAHRSKRPKPTVGTTGNTSAMHHSHHSWERGVAGVAKTGWVAGGMTTGAVGMGVAKVGVVGVTGGLAGAGAGAGAGGSGGGGASGWGRRLRRPLGILTGLAWPPKQGNDGKGGGLQGRGVRGSGVCGDGSGSGRGGDAGQCSGLAGSGDGHGGTTHGVAVRDVAGQGKLGYTDGAVAGSSHPPLPPIADHARGPTHARALPPNPPDTSISTSNRPLNRPMGIPDRPATAAEGRGRLTGMQVVRDVMGVWDFSRGAGGHVAPHFAVPTRPWVREGVLSGGGGGVGGLGAGAGGGGAGAVAGIGGQSAVASGPVAAGVGVGTASPALTTATPAALTTVTPAATPAPPVSTTATPLPPRPALSSAQIKHLFHPTLPLVVMQCLEPGKPIQATVVCRGDEQGWWF